MTINTEEATRDKEHYSVTGRFRAMPVSVRHFNGHTAGINP